MAYDAFVFEGYRYDPAAACLTLHYAYPGGPRFAESIAFEFPVRALSAADEAALDRLFRLLLLFAGVSYYKAIVPRRLVCDAFPLDEETARFVTDFYEQGLAEFAFRNRLSLRGHVELRGERLAPVSPVPLRLPRRTLVPVGGGKDSIVTIETLRRAGEALTLFALGEAEPIDRTIATADLPAIRVRRRLDPALFELNRAGALNGHVPITGILSVIALAAAVLHGCDRVAMSNEHSASEATLVADGIEVNHQYSKSFAFERDLSRYVTERVSPDLAYFSLLRPLSEVAIARRFAAAPQYFPVFRSCNTAFRQDPSRRGTQWCGDCPKCRFVFLALAPFLARPALARIFGKDLLDDPAQVEGYAALCGLGGHKPFECVGETAESAAVLARLAEMPQWRAAAVVRALRPLLPAARPSDYARLFEPRDPHLVPDGYLAMLDARR